MIYVGEHHDELLGLWRRQDLRAIRLCHVDFHDDLRGLLIDRRRRRSYPVGELARRQTPVDSGNFLAHAVLEGRIERIDWVHDVPGGRAWDLGIVRYESDWCALHHRLRHRLLGGEETALEFEERLLGDWPGVGPDERLSVDWDCFASRQLEAASLARRVDGFLERLGPRIPQETYLIYSPEYCHPSLESFLRFVAVLQGRFRRPVEWLAPQLAEGKIHTREGDGDPRPGPMARCILGLRRRGIY